MDQSAAERITSQRTMSGKELKGDDSETIVSFRIGPSRTYCVAMPIRSLPGRSGRQLARKTG